MSSETDQRIDVALVGATGYAGQELVRILARHPHVRLTAALGSASMEAPRKLPALARIWDGEVLPYSAGAHRPLGEGRLPGAARGQRRRDGARALLARGHPRHRPVGRVPPSRRRGPRQALSEDGDAAGRHGVRPGRARSRRRSRAAQLISCPGCYPTAALIALAPLEAAGLLEGDVIVDAKSGISGAGKAPSERTHFSENHGSVAAYGLFSHRHTAEIEQELGGRPVTFVPHLVPLDRGILETIYVAREAGHDRAAIAERFDAAYATRRSSASPATGCRRSSTSRTRTSATSAGSSTRRPVV